MLHSLAAAVTTGLLALHGWPVYVIIGAFAFLEAAAFVGLAVPGETGLIIGGVLAAQGSISIGVLLAVAIPAAIAGDSLGYEIGRRLGPSMRRSRLGRRIGDRNWDRAEEALRRRGPLTVVIGRFVGVLRALVPAVAGASNMPYRSFFVANAIGGILWSGLVVGAGFLAGAAWAHVQGTLALVGFIAAGLGAAWFLASWVRTRRAERRPLAAGAATSAVHGPIPVGASR